MATVVGAVVICIGWLLATRPRISRNVLVGILAACAVGVLASGVVTAARGERIIEHHEAEHGNDLSPYTPGGTNTADTTTTAPEGEG